MIAHPAMLSQAPVIPPDATRALRKREKRARTRAIFARLLRLSPRVEASHLEDARDAREARLDIEAPLFLGGPCRLGRHYGRMTDLARMDAAGGIWARSATCSCCGSTVGRSEFVPASNAVAMDDLLYAMGGEG